MQKNKKLYVSVLLAVIAIVCCAFAFSGCCQHGHESRRRAATCTENGYVEEFCFKCGYVFSSETYPALGHADYADGFCKRCGEPDPDDTTFADGGSFEFVRLSEDGILSWSRLKQASKYELSVTYSGDAEPTVYELEKKNASVNLDELNKADYSAEAFPAGKTAAKLTPYTIHKETVNGETVEQEYPMTDAADEFKIIKFNGKFELVRLKYADDKVTLNGFYSEVKYDENQSPYYLYELLLKDNKDTQFYIKNYVKTANGCTAQFYSTAQDRNSGANAISDMDLRFRYIHAGGDNVFYMRVSSAQGTADYDLRIYGLQTLKLKKYSTARTYDAYGYLNEYTQIGSTQIFTEGDIISSETLFAGISSDYARDAQYKLMRKSDYWNKGEDVLLSAPAFGDTVRFYFGAYVSDDCKDYEKYSEYYNLTETDYGWQLYADENNKEIDVGMSTLPNRIAGENVLSYTFNNVNATWLIISVGIKQLNITLESCSKLVKISIQSPETHIGNGAFAGANDSLEIWCGFASTEQTNFSSRWNAKNATNLYAGSYTVKYTDT